MFERGRERIFACPYMNCDYYKGYNFMFLINGSYFVTYYLGSEHTLQLKLKLKSALWGQTRVFPEFFRYSEVRHIWYQNDQGGCTGW